MIFIIFLLCGFAAFFCGFSLGLLRRGCGDTPKKHTAEPPSEEMERLRQEYRNFLEYDGSEQ